MWVCWVSRLLPSVKGIYSWSASMGWWMLYLVKSSLIILSIRCISSKFQFITLKVNVTIGIARVLITSNLCFAFNSVLFLTLTHLKNFSHFFYFIFARWILCFSLIPVCEFLYPFLVPICFFFFFAHSSILNSMTIWPLN